MNTRERDLQSIYSMINAIATGKHQPFTEQLLEDMVSQKIIVLRARVRVEQKRLRSKSATV